MNKCQFIGRLVRDPELRHTQSGVSICNFTLAIERKYKVNDEKVTDFINFVAWRGVGEVISKYLTKGQQMGVSGSLEIRSYEDKDNVKRYIPEINVDDIYFVGNKKDGNAASDSFDKTGADDGFTDVPVPSEDDLPF